MSRSPTGSVVENLMLEYSARIHPDDVDEVLLQMRSLLAFHAVDEGVLFKVLVRNEGLNEEVQ